MTTDVADAAPVIVEASLDNLTSRDVRFLQEAARKGPLHLRVPSDELVRELTGSPPAFPAAERLFLAESLRWVARAAIVDRPMASGIARDPVSASLLGFPIIEAPTPPTGTPRVVVTGCYDWLHSGHIRFFMDAAAYGALYAVVGSDRNVEFLKGPGHPLQREEERRYMVGSVRSVHQCLVSSGSGWMDAEPEIAHIQPTHYVVNEDGDQPDKREFCRAHGIEYVVLERIPHAGLPRRSSTDLRGF